MHLSFQVKKSKLNEFGKAPIYARITICDVRTEFSLKKFIEPDKWINKAGYAKGSTEEIKTLNNHVATVRTQLFQHYNRLLEPGKPISSESIKNEYFGITEKAKTISEVFDYHNKQMKSLINKDYAPGTYERYCTAYSHTMEFIKSKYNLSDYPVTQVNHQFITEYEYYLKTTRKCDHNTAMKYLTNFKKIMRICLCNNWIEKDPFMNYRFTLREVQREFLNEEEIQSIIDKQISMPRLDQVRDIFVFSCFTGLAYADVQKLSKDHIVIGIDGDKWIKINRTKTDTRSSIPLLPTAQSMIDKYATDPKCIANNRLLPVLSNQKMNSYLKEIADLCGISKNITYHLARHTFATTITLTNGVPIESVSRMLGHNSIKTTQHYAKIIDKRLSNDMMILKSKFNNSSPSRVSNTA